MSKKLENTFKDKLENFEMPYDSAAWDQFSKKLDGAAPAMKSYKNLQFAALIVGAVVIGSVIYFATSKEKESLTESKYNKELIEQQIDDAEGKNTNETFVADESGSKLIENEETVTNNDKNLGNSSVDVSKSELHPINKENANNNDAQQINNKEHVKSQNSELSRGNTPGDDDSNEQKLVKKRFVAGLIKNNQICEGDYLHITNNDADNGLVRIRVEDTDLTLPSGQFTEIKLTKSEEVYFLDEKGNVLESQLITVHENPQIDFTFEANLFEKGLPVTFFDAYGSFRKYEWNFGNDQSTKGAKVQTNYYSKGSFDAELTVTDHNNCKTTKTRQVVIENDYNLMASNAFRPNDHDIRNNTFMPYALTQRDVDFEMVIVDPKSHAVLFKTNDASKGWDGIDQRTGQMTAENKTYVWKVHLENPEPREKAIYMGTVLLKK